MTAAPGRRARDAAGGRAIPPHPVPTPRQRGRKAQAQRNRRLALDNGLCRLCRDQGIYRPADVIDHIVPLARGGPDIDRNCRALCNDCHDAVTRQQFGLKPKPPRIGVDGWPVE